MSNLFDARDEFVAAVLADVRRTVRGWADGQGLPPIVARPANLVVQCDEELDCAAMDDISRRLNRWITEGGVLLLPTGVTLYQTIDGKITKVVPA